MNPLRPIIDHFRRLRRCRCAACELTRLLVPLSTAEHAKAIALATKLLLDQTGRNTLFTTVPVGDEQVTVFIGAGKGSDGVKRIIERGTARAAASESGIVNWN